MSERYFLALLAVVVSAAAVWLAVVDSEGDLTYYEVKRIKP